MDETKPLGEVDRKPVLEERYELLERIGVGGMAEVWRARDRRLRREVAVKLLDNAGAREAGRRRRIAREARALGAISHPNIVTVYDYGETKTPPGEIAPYVVTELIEGGDLHSYLEANAPIGVDEAMRILRGVLAGVERAHSAGIVHGDLKPANILMGAHGPKVGDFGVARILDEETGTTTAAATPTFAAPEVLSGGRPTPASDVYSVGCLAFQMLTGRAPYEGSNAWEIASKHLHEPAPHVMDFRPDVPMAFADALHRSMDKKPKRRFASAAEFARTVDVGGETTQLPVPPPPPSTSEATEAVGSGIDLRAVALLGPFAGWAQRQLARSRRAGSYLRGPRRRPALAAIALGLLLVFVLLLTGSDGNVEVPNVEGQTAVAAATLLRQAQLEVAGFSYGPVTEGEPGRVLRTIPGAGEMVEPGSPVHIIAAALAQTPEPPPAPVEPKEAKEKDEDRDEDRGRGRGGRDDD